MKRISKRIGQLFITGFPGEEPPAAFLDFVSEEQLGGVILFEENCPTHAKARENIEIIRSRMKTGSPFIAVDQEGGRVSRVRGIPVEFRSPAEYGRKKEIEHFIEEYRRSMVYLESLGFNLNFAPVADIFLNEENTCLKDRCFGADPGTVSLFVKAAVQVARSSGILSCLKHFPGLGAATVDPHVDTATADYDMFVWKSREMIPFADGIASGADFLMTTHLLLPEISDTIATGSREIISEMARTMLSFDGPIITDDLTMDGASTLGNIGERTVAAFNAGHDLLLFGRDYEAAIRAYDYFMDAFARGDISERQVSSALNRVTGTKYKLVRSVLK